eukprot:m.9332 g.9332  ORF g.9332 m.9332 type:complete len:108 (+) comp2964_c0_seq1:1132-1455(+)
MSAWYSCCTNMLQALDGAQLRAEDIDEIVLVGGTTRTPRVRELLREYFGKEPDTSVNPDEAVAVGVAIQAGVVGGSWPLPVAVRELPFGGRKTLTSSPADEEDDYDE